MAPTLAELEAELVSAKEEHERELVSAKEAAKGVLSAVRRQDEVRSRISLSHDRLARLRDQLEQARADTSPWESIGCRRDPSSGMPQYMFARSGVVIDHFAQLGKRVMVRFPDGQQVWLLLQMTRIGKTEECGVFVPLFGLTVFVGLHRVEVKRDNFRPLEHEVIAWMESQKEPAP